MLDIKYIRENPEKVKEGCRKRGVDCNISRILELDEKRRELLGKIEGLKARQNKLGREEIEEARKLKDEIKKLEPQMQELKGSLHSLLSLLPNMPQEDVPVGDEKANVVVREVGKKPKLNFPSKDYLEIGEALDLIDVKRAAKVAGTRFGYLKGGAALLEFALVKLAFDTLLKEGFVPVIPPVMLKSEMARGMGYLEQTDKEEAYYLPQDNLYLIGTSEQSIGVMHSQEVFEEKDLPRRYLGFSTCFRREAGSYGKDTKGIMRVHQFDKVEMFSFCHPGKSREEHCFLLKMQEKLMQSLKLPYQVVQLSTKELGRPSASTFDIETWIPSEERYRETHSTSNCTDYQARRLNIRYRDSKTKKLEFVHTLNATAFAIGRTLIAILENYQQKDGSVDIPKTLQKYVGEKEIKRSVTLSNRRF